MTVEEVRKIEIPEGLQAREGVMCLLLREFVADFKALVELVELAKEMPD